MWFINIYPIQGILKGGSITVLPKRKRDAGHGEEEALSEDDAGNAAPGTEGDDGNAAPGTEGDDGNAAPGTEGDAGNAAPENVALYQEVQKLRGSLFFPLKANAKNF